MVLWRVNILTYNLLWILIPPHYQILHTSPTRFKPRLAMKMHIDFFSWQVPHTSIFELEKAVCNYFSFCKFGKQFDEPRLDADNLALVDSFHFFRVGIWSDHFGGFWVFWRRVGSYVEGKLVDKTYFSTLRLIKMGCYMAKDGKYV